MSNSPLVIGQLISPNKTSPRDHKIDVVTPHCVVGHFSAENICRMFQPVARKASCNYAIGDDGEIMLCVDEKDRSWCSSSASNDHRAITIECSCDKYYPFAMNDKVLDSLAKLMADIAKRNNIPELLWKSDKTLIGKVDQQNVTVHRWFSNIRSCPGDFLYERLYEVCGAANKLLGVSAKDSDEPFRIRVTVPELVVYKTPRDFSSKVPIVLSPGVYTIVKREGDWGLLKSGAGWVCLKPIFAIGEE